MLLCKQRDQVYVINKELISADNQKSSTATTHKIEKAMSARSFDEGERPTVIKKLFAEESNNDQQEG